MYQAKLNEDIRKRYNGALGQFIGAGNLLYQEYCPFKVSNVLKAVSGKIKVITADQLPHLERDKIRSLIFESLQHKPLSEKMRKELENTEWSLSEVKAEDLHKLFFRLRKLRDEIVGRIPLC